MIVIASTVSVRKILACVLEARPALTGAAVPIPHDAQTDAAALNNMRTAVILRTNEHPVALVRHSGCDDI